MEQPTIDWNELWRKAQAKKHAPTRDPNYWDERAHEFNRHATTGDYIAQFMAIMKLEPHWSILDVGCAAGTLAIPLAPLVKTVTAMDSSKAMLSLLEDRCRKEGIENIRIINGAWEDDWNKLGVGTHDVAIASRSLIVDDLKAAVLKLQNQANKRVYVSALVDDGPHDRRIVEAAGREFRVGADYIHVFNLLSQLGIYANVSFTHTREEKTYSDVEDALNSMRWMVHGMTPEEEKKLRSHLSECLVPEGGRWKLPYPRVVRWAVLWWDIE